MTLNEKTVTMRLKRLDLFDLLLAVSAVMVMDSSTRWTDLYDKLLGILNDFDAKHAEE